MYEKELCRISSKLLSFPVLIFTFLSTVYILKFTVPYIMYLNFVSARMRGLWIKQVAIMYKYISEDLQKILYWYLDNLNITKSRS